MTHITFFTNSSSLANISIIKAQLGFFNPKTCSITINSELVTTNTIANFRKTYFDNLECTVSHVNETNDCDIYCFTISKVSDLIYLRDLPRNLRKLIIIVSFDVYSSELFKYALTFVETQETHVSICIRYHEDFFVLPYTKGQTGKIQLRNLRPRGSGYDFFARNCWLPLFVMDVSNSIRLDELHSDFLFCVLEGRYSFDRMYSDIYLQRLKTRLPKSHFHENFEQRIRDDILKKAYLDYILNKTAGYTGHHRILGELASGASEKNFVDIHSLLDPVNSMGLSSRGIKFCTNTHFSKVVFTMYDHIRKGIAPDNRVLAKTKRTNTIVFVLGRFFPDNVSDKSNSHYNVLKLFSALVNHFNSIQCECKFSIKIIITKEKSFKTPFGTKDTHTDHIYRDNRKHFIRDGIIEKRADLIVSEGDSKTDCIASSLDKVNDLKPLSCIFLGGTYDSKVARSQIYRFHPVSFLPTTSTVDNAFGVIDNHIDAVRSVSDYHGRLISELGIQGRKIFHFPKPMFEKMELALTDWDWKEYTDAENSFFLSTPLAGGRIINWLNSLTEDEVCSFASLFETCPNLHWVPIGAQKLSLVNTINKNAKLRELFEQNRIIPIEFTTDLGSLLDNSDAVFIPSLGGATTVAAATSLRKACIVDERSDSNTIVPIDGQFENFSEAFDLISKVYHSSEFYNRLVSYSTENLDKRFNVDAISRQFIEFLQNASEIALGKK